MPVPTRVMSFFSIFVLRILHFYLLQKTILIPKILGQQYRQHTKRTILLPVFTIIILYFKLYDTTRHNNTPQITVPIIADFQFPISESATTISSSKISRPLKHVPRGVQAHHPTSTESPRSLKRIFYTIFFSIIQHILHDTL